MKLTCSEWWEKEVAGERGGIMVQRVWSKSCSQLHESQTSRSLKLLPPSGRYIGFPLLASGTLRGLSPRERGATCWGWASVLTSYVSLSRLHGSPHEDRLIYGCNYAKSKRRGISI
jgi:hypothetical protein